MGGNGRTYTETFVVYEDDIYDVDTMYKGARATFYTVVEVPAAAVAGGRWLITDDSDYSNQKSAWFER